MIEPWTAEEIERLRPAPAGHVRAGSMTRTARRLSDRHVLLIVRALMAGPLQYSALKSESGVDSDTTLSTRLKAMQRDGLIDRSPDRGAVTYALTESGRDAFPIFVALWDWERQALGRRHLTYHHACDHLADAIFDCEHCHEAVLRAEVDLVLGSGGGFDPRPETRHRRRSTATSDTADLKIDSLTIDVVGNFWSMTILAGVFGGCSTFGELAAALGTPTAVLADRLQDLVSSGILSRTDGAGQTARSGYALTTTGELLYPTMMMFLRWGDRWTATEAGPPMLHRHTTCGQLFNPRLVCSKCGEPFACDDTTLALAL